MVELAATGKAFAVVTAEGGVVAWGEDRYGGDLGAARGLIGRMQRREVQQKAVLTVVAAILIAAIGTVSYYSFS